jgi:hypothetical protein
LDGPLWRGPIRTSDQTVKDKRGWLARTGHHEAEHSVMVDASRVGDHGKANI